MKRIASGRFKQTCLRLLEEARQTGYEPGPGTWIRRALRASPTSMLVLTHDIAQKSESLESFPHGDPADRFLVASCLLNELILITADQALLRYPPLSALW